MPGSFAYLLALALIGQWHLPSIAVKQCTHFRIMMGPP